MNCRGRARLVTCPPICWLGNARPSSRLSTTQLDEYRAPPALPSDSEFLPQRSNPESNAWASTNSHIECRMFRECYRTATVRESVPWLFFPRILSLSLRESVQLSGKYR